MRRSTLALLALLFGIGLAASAASGAPPPVDVCGVCGLADGEGYPPDQPDATIVESSLTITIAEDGTTRWVETATVGEETARRLRTDESYRERVAESERIVTRPQNLTATLDGQQFTVRYGGQRPATQRVGGVVVFDFDQSSYRPSIGEYAVTVRGPGETVPRRVPGNGERVNGAAVWASEATDGFGRTRVVFGPSGPVGAVLGSVVGRPLRVVAGGLLVAAILAGGRRVSR
ncbi:hypothetical protein [Halosegnis longus]|uniref:Uncharacterized protein n=1 Tax=Halosegnis longus TaxID=2216012 RepID=A0AAJ4UV41_9EURY|nr:hypothetical protein [Salella cibi]RNJ25524.1 hypothetical protein Nmn1133_01685 [Salella cibi]